jgi:hypothetical protein
VTATPPAAGATAPAVPSPSQAAGGASLSQLVVDPNLLSVLPASVAGVEIQPSPETAAGMIADARLAEAASALAVGAAIAPGASGGDDLAISTVIRLRPGVFNDVFYGGWRASYDEAACAPAGGVASHDQQRIGGHDVEVTVCAEGARTYHTHLDGDVVVSIISVGDREFGALVMAGLRG